MALLDLLSRRWALRILWELRAGEPNFRELQQHCGSISSSVLSDRLRELGEAGIVAHSGKGYTLTPPGRDLLARLLPLNEWAEHWQPAATRNPGPARPPSQQKRQEGPQPRPHADESTPPSDIWMPDAGPLEVPPGRGDPSRSR
jgi:DNA-binding HxlR family transcriptional regulator